MTLSRYLDRIAIALSTICIVHCLVMPVLVAVLPIAAVAFGSDGHFHALMLWLVVPTSVLGFSLGFRVHRMAGVVALGMTAVAVLALVALWGHDVWDPTVEVAVNVGASLLLASAHWRNFREVRRVHRHA
jgi:MerC mercury resistance protein